jgi:hypothetical protein
VEWLAAKIKGRTVINAVNLLRHPVQASILKGNRPVTATDLLSLGGREPVETLNPMVPVLCVPARSGSAQEIVIFPEGPGVRPSGQALWGCARNSPPL